MSTALAAPQRIVRALPKETESFEQMVLICNILSEPVNPIIHPSFGAFHVPWPREGEAYATYAIPWQDLYIDKGGNTFGKLPGQPNEDKREKTKQGAREIAEDICQQLNTGNSPPGADGTGPFWGLFVCKSKMKGDGAIDGPTDEELEVAHRRLKTYFSRLVDVGDADWGRAQRLDLIDNRCKIAARHLGISKPWMAVNLPSKPCEWCGESILAIAKLCWRCGKMVGDAGKLYEAQNAKPGKRGRKAASEADPDSAL